MDGRPQHRDFFSLSDLRWTSRNCRPPSRCLFDLTFSCVEKIPTPPLTLFSALGCFPPLRGSEGSRPRAGDRRLGSSRRLRRRTRLPWKGTFCQPSPSCCLRGGRLARVYKLNPSGFRTFARGVRSIYADGVFYERAEGLLSMPPCSLSPPPVRLAALVDPSEGGFFFTFSNPTATDEAPFQFLPTAVPPGSLP